ncbi:MAG: acetylglutamate kinase [Dehalococcoidia bacterium]|nr:acetylglutamate kinase [Dehalococcoidia bacterium]
MTKTTLVIKVGGSALGSLDTSLADLVALHQSGLRPVVVHGGGDLISSWLKRMGVATRFVRGLRVTDAETMRVVAAVLAGLVNKELVASITTLGGRAFGMSGVEGGFIRASVADPELGYVGSALEIDLRPLNDVLKAGYIPVISPICLQKITGGGGPGVLLNVNGDAVAGQLALSLRASKLVFLTDVAGICDASGEVIPYLSPEEAKGLISSGVVSGGMIPKVEACILALEKVQVARIIDGRTPHALLREMEDGEGGTTIGRTR